MNRLLKYFLLCAFFPCVFAGCASPENQLSASEKQAMLRKIQSRYFDTTDKIKAMRAVMATLQDLNFKIEGADSALGTVTADKLMDYKYDLSITVTVSDYSSSQVIVRAEVQYYLSTVEKPRPYQQFFDALEKTMALPAHNIDEDHNVPCFEK